MAVHHSTTSTPGTYTLSPQDHASKTARSSSSSSLSAAISWFPLKPVGFMLAFIVLLGLALEATRAETIWLLRVVLYTLFGTAAVGIVAGPLLGLLWLREAYLLRRAKRRTVERDMEFYCVTAEGNIAVRERNPRAIWRVYGRAALPAATSSSAPLETTQMSVMDVLDATMAEPRVLIKGQSGAGKTTLLRALAQRLLAQGEVWVLDPHAYPEKWPGCRVVGQGSDHAAIAQALEALVAEMLRRYQDIAAGRVAESAHPPLAVIIDEWMSIAHNEQCQNASMVLCRLLTESRKAAFLLYIGSHSDRVESLGLARRGDLRDGLAIVRLYRHGQAYSATLDVGDGEQALHWQRPPSVHNVSTASTTQTLLRWPHIADITHSDESFSPRGADAQNEEREENEEDEDRQVLRRYQAGESYREISKAVWGKHGGYYNRRIEAILERNDVGQMGA